MAGGGIGGMINQAMNQASPSINKSYQPASGQTTQQTPMMPLGQGTNPAFTTSSNQMSPVQSWWMGPGGDAATAAMNKTGLDAFNQSKTPIDKSQFYTTSSVDNGESGGSFNTTTFNQAAYDAAVAAQNNQPYKPITNQEAFNQTLRDQIQGAMGNYPGMINAANTLGISEQDVRNAMGNNGDMYTYLNRPSASAPQFYSPVYRPSYGDQQGAAPGYNMNAGLGGWNNSYNPGYMGQNYGGFGSPVYGQGQASTSGDLAGGALSGLGGQNLGIAANPYAQSTGGAQAQVLPTFAQGGITTLVD